MEGVSGTLRSLLALLQRHPLSLPPAEEFMQATNSVCASAIQQTDAADAGFDGSSAALARQAGQLGRLLARLDGQVLRAARERGHRGGLGPFVLYAEAGLRCLQAAAAAAYGCPQTAADGAGLLCGMALLVGSGLRALDSAAGWQERHPWLQANLKTGYAILKALTSNATPASTPGTGEASAAIAPAATLRWLAALTDTLLVAPERLREYTDRKLAVCIYGTLLHPHLGGTFGPLQAAMQADLSLQQRVARVLLSTAQLATPHVLAAAGSSVPGQPVKPSQDLLAHWVILSECLSLGYCRSLNAGFKLVHEQLEHHAALLQLVSSLVDGLPFEWPSGVPAEQHLLMWKSVSCLLGQLLSSTTGQNVQQAEVRHAAAFTCLRLLPRVAAAWQVLAAQQWLQQAGMLSALVPLVQAVKSLPDSVPPVSSAPQLGVLLAAADAALSLLPLLDRFLPEGGHLTLAHTMAVAATVGFGLQQQAGGAEAAIDLARETLLWEAVQNISRFFTTATERAAAFAASAADGTSDWQAEVAAQLPAALQQHTRVCRLMQWLALAEPRCLLLLGGWPGVLMIAAHSMDAVRMVGAQCDTTPELWHRPFRAAHAAHWEALQAVASRQTRPLLQPVGQDNTELAAAVSWCLQLAMAAEQVHATQLTPLLLRELHTAAQFMRQSSLPEATKESFLHLVWEACHKSQHLSAALLLAGTLEQGYDALQAADWQQICTAARRGERQPANLASRQVTNLLHVAADAHMVAEDLYASEYPAAHARGAQLDAAARHLESSLPFAMQPAAMPGGHATLREQPDVNVGEIKAVALTVARLLQQYWAQPEQQAAAQLDMAHVAASRGCAYLRCANVEAGTALLAGAVGRTPGSKRCSGCLVVRYCGEGCSHADWRGPAGHRRVCAALAAERLAQQAQQA